MKEFIDPDNWFEIHKIDNYAFIIRERLDLIEPRYLTKYINNYLLIGDHSAALIDTGTGIHKISSAIKDLIGDRELLVFNTHNHFDHVLSNHEFPEVHIHKLDYKEIADHIDITFLESIDIATYKKHDYKVPNTKIMNILVGGEKFDLGDISIEILHTPGHTPGSICILSSENHLFTGDVIHYGAVFLPSDFADYDKILVKLRDRIAKETRLFPGHEDYNVGIELINEFIQVFKKIENGKSIYNEFLDADVIEFDKFSIIIEHKEEELD
jgi:glyoxylase-like metal-dependent hydrolase (beta-lactamase superfamily II)